MKIDLVCWDSSVLIDWIKGDDQDRMKRIGMVVSGVEQDKYRIVVSTLAYVEVLESTMPEGTMKMFQQFMQNRKQVEVVTVDIRVAQKAQLIRNNSRKKLSTPDAVHIATAIVSGANLFHTFDDGLLQLSGKDEVEGLTITPCDIPGTGPTLF